MEIKKILFPTDFEEGSAHAVPFAVDLAMKYSAELYIFHVVHEVTDSTGLYVPHATLDDLYDNMEKEDNKEIRRTYLEEVRGLKDVNYTVTRGIPHEEITGFAEKNGIDLIVMSTHCRKGLEKVFFGSTAEKVVKKTPCPVFLAPPERSSE